MRFSPILLPTLLALVASARAVPDPLEDPLRLAARQVGTSSVAAPVPAASSTAAAAPTVEDGLQEYYGMEISNDTADNFEATPADLAWADAFLNVDNLTDDDFLTLPTPSNNDDLPAAGGPTPPPAVITTPPAVAKRNVAGNIVNVITRRKGILKAMRHRLHNANHKSVGTLKSRLHKLQHKKAGLAAQRKSHKAHRIAHLMHVKTKLKNQLAHAHKVHQKLKQAAHPHHNPRLPKSNVWKRPKSMGPANIGYSINKPKKWGPFGQ